MLLNKDVFAFKTKQTKIGEQNNFFTSTKQTSISSQWVNLMRYFKFCIRRQLTIGNSNYGKSRVF